MKMSRDERWLDICPIQFTSNRPRSRAFPDRVLDIHDRRHQCHKAKIALDHCQQCADPAAVTGGQHAELATASFAQSLHQLPQFDHPLAQSFRIANEVRCDGNPAVSECFSESRVAMSGVIFFGSKGLACAYVTLHLLATAPV